MNLLHLKYFYTVATEGGFSKASQVLKVNQSALSRMVKQFEEEMQMVLLERLPRGVKLTSTGEGIYSRASEIFKRVDELRAGTGELTQVCQGELRIGSTDVIAKYLLPSVTKSFLNQWPAVYPTFQCGSSSDLLPHITSGRLEFALFFHTPELPRSLAITKRWPVRFHLVCSKANVKNARVLERFIGSREVDDTFNRKFPTVQKWKKTIPSVKIAVSSNSLLFHLELVKQGVGISILPEFLIKKDLVKGTVVDLLPKDISTFDLKLVQRKDAAVSLNGRTFLESLVRNIEP